METFSKENLPKGQWGLYKKRALTRAMRIEGPFQVKTRHKGVVICQDGYLALDSQGYPYPIAEDEFKIIYE